MGHLIADNVILTSSACCEDIIDFQIIDSSGGTNGAISAISVYVNGGYVDNESHGKGTASQHCKYGQKKNGKCKKAGRRRRDEENEDDSVDTICVLKTPYKITPEDPIYLSIKPAKDRFTNLLSRVFIRISLITWLKGKGV